jgi:hypothetical protein
LPSAIGLISYTKFEKDTVYANDRFSSCTGVHSHGNPIAICAIGLSRCPVQNNIAANQLERAIEDHQAGSNKSYLSEGTQLLELVRVLLELFERQPPREKRELLKFVVSNSAWKEGALTVTYRQPFDLFTTWRAAMNNEPAPKGMKKGPK